jgi:gentisate 1,2-dioxygenase
MISLQELHFEDMKQHIEEKEELKQKIEALTEWCSQPVWKRTTSFVLPKEPEDRFVSEF